MKNKDIIKIESYSSDKKIINCRITEKCNYKCPYCWYPGRDPVNLESDLEKINNMFENLKYVIDYNLARNKKITFFLTGGEPSLYPLSFYNKFFDIIAEKKIEKIILSTNFSANANWFIGFADKCKGNVILEIKAAFHQSGCNIDDYIEKIKLVKDYVDTFTAHFTFDDNNFIGMEKINQIKQLDVNLDVVPIHSKDNKDYGVYKITNPDLLSLLPTHCSNKHYTIYYKDGSTEKVSTNFIKEMDFSELKPICEHTNITILQNKIGINCEYMRSIQRIIPANWMDISVKRSKKEIYDYLENDCCLLCDKKSIPLGNNCKPTVLTFQRNTIFNKLCKLIKKK